MATNTNIYGNQQSFKAPSVLDSMTKGSTLRSIALKNQAQEQEIDSNQRTNDMTAHLQKASAFGNALEGISGLPPEQRTQAYGEVRNQLIQGNVIKPEDAPEQYDDGFYRNSLIRYRQSAPAIENQLKQAQAAHLKGQTAKDLAEARKKGAGNPNKEAFDALPPENQEQIKDLARQTGAKSSIKNQIDSALSVLDDPNVSEDQKVTMGQQLLKTLNSTEGKDAVGSEESKRLGSFLQKKMFNFTQPGSMFGRDLGEFVDQVKLTSGAIGQATERNKAQMDELYGRRGRQIQNIAIPETALAKNGSRIVQDAQAAPPDIRPGTVVDGFVYMGGDKANAKSWKKAR